MKRMPDIKQFNQLFNEYYPRLVRFASGYVRDEQVAEDYVSEAFTAYWENYGELEAGTKPQAYILTIVRNKCLNHLKHLQVRRRVEQLMSEAADWRLSVSINTLEATDPDFLFSDEIRKIVEDALKKLPERRREIFVYNRFEGLTYAQIAEKLNISVKSVEYHMSNALKVFRVALKEFVSVLLFLYLLK